MKLSGQIRYFSKHLGQLKGTKTQARKFFLELADQASQLEARVLRFAMAIDDLLPQPDGPGLPPDGVWSRLTDEDRVIIGESHALAALEDDHANIACTGCSTAEEIAMSEISIDDALQEYADALGCRVDELDANEKQQAIMLAIMGAASKPHQHNWQEVISDDEDDRNIAFVSYACRICKVPMMPEEIVRRLNATERMSSAQIGDAPIICEVAPGSKWALILRETLPTEQIARLQTQLREWWESTYPFVVLAGGPDIKLVRLDEPDA